MTECEPLRKKIVTQMPIYAGERKPTINELFFKFNDVKSAVEFYKKYKLPHGENITGLISSNMGENAREVKLKEENPRLWEAWATAYKEHSKKIRKVKFWELEPFEFNDWLFDFSFSDVTKEV